MDAPGGAAGAGAAVNDDLLAQHVGHLRREQPRGDVHAAAGNEAVQHAHRTRRPFVRALRVGVRAEGK